MPIFDHLPLNSLFFVLSDCMGGVGVRILWEGFNILGRFLKYKSNIYFLSFIVLQFFISFPCLKYEYLSLICCGNINFQVFILF